jgi:hypothetical protein
MSTITRKPKAGQGAVPSAEEEKINALIFKGMASPEETSPTPMNESDEQQVKLRLPTSLLKKVDAAVKAQPIKTSRHRWLMEAIVEKLERAS